MSSGEFILNLSCGDVFFETCTVTRIVKRFIDTNCRVLVTSRIQYNETYKYQCLLPHYTERNIIAKLDNN